MLYRNYELNVNPVGAKYLADRPAHFRRLGNAVVNGSGRAYLPPIVVSRIYIDQTP